MAGLPEVIGLLYRADWTRLSLSAELRSETDREPLPRLSRERLSRWYRAWPGQRQDNGRYVGRGALLIGPGGRWRLECPVPGRGAGGEAAEGNDGEGGWSWRPPEVGGPPPLPVGLGAAYPPPAELFCPSCLLGGYTLEELGPVTVAGLRPARQLRVTPVPGREEMVLGPLMMYPTDAIVDAETGCLLRLISYAGDTLAIWSELDDISTEPADPDEFRVHVPPGTRTVEETGNLVADTFATMPGLTGTAVRAAGEAVNRTAGAVSAARSFLDDLRGGR